MLTSLPALALGLALALPQGGGPGRDIGVALEELHSEDAATRERAQRRLAAGLRKEDFPEVARAAREADPEARRRLVDALSSDDRHLGLVVLLASERERAPLELGEEAFAELVVRWCPGAAAEPSPREDVERLVRYRSPGIYSLAAGASSAREHLERLERLTDLGLAVVVLPEARAEAALELGELTGTSWELLGAVVEAAPLSVAGVGRWDGDAWAPPGWILIAGRGRERRDSGLGLLRAWCLEVQGGGGQAPAAALALAATGWPAGLDWLESLWLDRGEEAALAGLVHAAERGRAAPAVLQPGTRARILSRAEELSGSAPARAAAYARALSATAALAGRAGSEASLLHGWQELAPASLAVRLIALEGGPVAGERAALAELAWGAHGRGVAVRLQALRVLARAGAAGEAPSEQLEAVLLALADAAPPGGELPSLLTAVGARPPDASLAWSPGPRARFLFAWSLRAGRPEVATELLRGAAFGAPAELGAWAEACASAARVAGREPVRTCLEQRADGGESLLLLADLATPEESGRAAQRLLERVVLSPAELRLLGALAAGPSGVRVRERLVEELRAVERLRAEPARSEALQAGLAEAAERLGRARQDEALGRWARSVWRASRAEGHPLRGELGLRDFPGRSEPTPVALGAVERSL